MNVEDEPLRFGRLSQQVFFVAATLYDPHLRRGETADEGKGFSDLESPRFEVGCLVQQE